MASRRDLLKTLSLLGIAPTARAQIGKPPLQAKRIGVLDWNADSSSPQYWAKFWQELGNRGWTLGKNLQVESVNANGDLVVLDRLAAQLVRNRVDVIMTDGGITSVAAARATKTIPILFSDVYFPIEQELVESYAHPGGNITGIAFYSEIEVSTKRLQFLREIAPRAKRLAWVSIQENVFQAVKVSGGVVDMIPRRRVAAKIAGFDAEFHYVKTVQELDGLFETIAAQRADAISCGGWSFEPIERVPDLALRQRLPSAFANFPEVKAGGLLSFTVAESEYKVLFSRTMDYLDRILRGERPANLPIEQAKRYEFAVNLKTAKILGLKVPPAILLRADVVIE